MTVLAPTRSLTERSAADLQRGHARINAVVVNRFDAARQDADAAYARVGGWVPPPPPKS